MNPPPAPLRAIFDAALDRNAGPERDAYIVEACQGDEALRDRVRALLLAHDDAGQFLADPTASPSNLDPDPEADTDPIPQTRDPSTDEIKMPRMTFDDLEIEGPGTHIGPYKLLQAIGEGGMGVVYMAEQERPIRRRVALKVIKAGMDTSQVVARFEAERQALAMMDHTNIAKVLDAGVTDAGRPYFVMELVKGIPITQFCDEARLTPKQRLELFIPVCQAIQHAHQKGIIHRDIKPSNVLVTLVDGHPVPKVIDFGVAKAINQRLTERTLFTQFGAIIGTPEYMSPEQAEISAVDVDTRSDIYSLGVLLYELLTGTTPLDHETLRQAAFAEILKRIREEEPPRPSMRLSDSGDRLAGLSAVRGIEPLRLTRLVQGDLDWIVMKSLDKDRSRRYETADSFAQDVRRYLEGDPVEACPPSARYRLGKFARKHRGAIATASAFALLLVAATVISVVLAISATRARDEAKAMSKFLLDVFEKPDPAVRGSSLKVTEYLDEAKRQLDADTSLSAASRQLLREILDRAVDEMKGLDLLIADLLGGASRKLDGDRSIPLLTKGSLFHALGKTFRGLGQYQTSSEAFAKAFQVLGDQLGPTHRDTLAARAEIVSEHNYPWDKNGESSGRATVSTCEKALGIDDRITIQARRNLGDFLTQIDVRKAIPLAEENLRLAEARYPPGDWPIYESRHGLGFAYRCAGRFRDGLRETRRAFEEKRAALGPEHPGTMAFRQSVAKVARFADDSEESISIFSDTLRTCEVRFGPDHPRTLATIMLLADIFEENFRRSESMALRKDALKRAADKYGFDDENTLRFRMDIAGIEMREGRAPEAIAELSEILEIKRKRWPDDSEAVLECGFVLGQAYWWAGRRGEALAMFEHYARLGEKATGFAGGNALDCQMALAEFLFYEARFDESLTEIARLSNHSEVVKGPEAVDSIFDNYVPAAIDATLRPSPEAVKRYREIVDEFQSRSLRITREVLLRRSLQADFAFSAGLFEEAETVWKEVLPKLPYDIAEVAAWGGMKSRLGSIYLDRKEYAKAEPLIVAAYRELEVRKDRLMPLYKDRPAEVARRVVRLYEEWGKPEEAAEWRKKLALAAPELPTDVFARP